MSGRNLKRGSLASVTVGIVAVALVVPLAFGAAETIRSSASCCTYTKSQFSSDQGDVPVFDNATVGGIPHDVSSTQRGPDGKPLFRSKVINGGSTPVSGAQYLAAGTYRFFCTIHGAAMSANLLVSSQGTPAARPRVGVRLPSQTLGAVRRSGKLTVGLRAVTASKGISLVAKKGRTTLGSKSGLNLAAGATRTVKVTLTAAGRRALQGVRSAVVSVRASVAFGRPDTTSRRLR